MVKRLRLAALCAALSLALCGCANQLTERRAAEMPLPDIQIAYPAPGEDGVADRVLPAVLHYLNQDATRLRSDAVNVTVRGGESEAEAVLRALFTDKVPDGLYAAAPGVQLQREGGPAVTVCEGVATVNLSASARLLTPRALYAARVAIANTLTELPDISYVNVLVEGREEGLNLQGTLPAGTFSRQAAGDVEILWQQVEVQQNQSAAQGFTRAVTVYVPSPEGTLMLPQVRSIAFGDAGSATLIAAVLREVAKGNLRDAHAPPMPDLLAYLVGE
ncbi:MAG: GerMN domain-containing protein, partial [Oscillospiraceae bacterium]|nr:GerMN domain-containing protein [Oscillospiraceae bacterium]